MIFNDLLTQGRGETPLYSALSADRLEVAEFLILLGANLHASEVIYDTFTNVLSYCTSSTRTATLLCTLLQERA